MLRRLPLSFLKYFWIFLAFFVIVLVSVFTYAYPGNTMSHYSAPVEVAGFRKDFYPAVLNRGVRRVPQERGEANHPKGQNDSG